MSFWKDPSKRARVVLLFAGSLLTLRLIRGRSLRTKRQSGTARELWIIDQYAVPPSLAGFTRQHEHAAILAQLGWRTTIFASPFEPKRQVMERPVYILHPKVEQSEQGTPFVWLHSVPYSGNNWRRYLNMVSFLVICILAGFRRRAPDVILASSPHLLAGLAGWILAKWHRVPFVLEIRDLWPESLVQLGLSNKPVIKTLETLERFLYTRANLIVALTEGIDRSIRAKGFDRRNIVMVPNASRRPKPLVPEQRDSMRNSLGWGHSTVAIWIGAHGPANGLDVIIDAARLLVEKSNLLFVLVGGGSDKPRLMGRARDLRNVQFLDPVPKAAVDDYLRAADIGLLVHRDTAAVKGARPNKLFDYMAAALPIVINIDGEARRLTEEAGAGMYVPAERPDALAAAVLELYEHADRRSRLGACGFEHVTHAHSREDTVMKLQLALNDVLDRWSDQHAN